MEFKKYKRVGSSVELKALTGADIRELVASDYKVVTNSGEVKVFISEKDQLLIDNIMSADLPKTHKEIFLYLAHSGDTDYWCVSTEFASKNYFCEVFDAGKVDTFDFGTAVALLKLGHKVARSGWNGKNMWIVYMSGMELPPYDTQGTDRKVNDRTAKLIGEDTPLITLPYIAMWTADDTWLPGWLASQSDVLAEDWVVVT